MNEQVRQDVYTLVTTRIIELLAQGTIPWKQPWRSGIQPMNLMSRNPYRGINLLLLNSLGYDQPYFLTYKQVNDIGASVKKGERSQFVVFWHRKEVIQEEVHGHEPVWPPKAVLRYYRVFNIEQCSNVPATLITAPPQNALAPIDRCVEIVTRMQQCPEIRYKGKEAFYDPTEDSITIPKLPSFTSAEGFYSTLFHELVHSTGHERRLNRKEVAEPVNFGSASYSLEELTAEIGACYLTAYAGIMIDELKNNAAYINGWLKVLQGDKRFVVFASTRAQHAVDFILNASPRNEVL